MIQKMLCCALLLMLLCSAALAEERAVLDPRVQPAVALSFDDGPSEFTQQIIDLRFGQGAKFNVSHSI